jgi:hypothetical protein
VSKCLYWQLGYIPLPIIVKDDRVLLTFRSISEKEEGGIHPENLIIYSKKTEFKKIS